MKVPKAITDLIDSFRSLPGIGPKSAQRLAYYLLHVPQAQLDGFASSLTNLKKKTVFCSVCRNISESDPCDICLQEGRDKETIMVVEQPLEVLAFEKTGRYNGLYHVLHGKISPLENIGPDEIYIEDLLNRIRTSAPGAERAYAPGASEIREVIIATNPTMEGEATAMYLTKEIKSLPAGRQVKITRLGMGVPTGADLEYADSATLREAIEGRREV